MPDFLLELFSEEIPARFQQGAEQQLREKTEALLRDLGLVSEGCTPETFSTPRRLAVRVQGVAAWAPAQSFEKRGPRVGAPDLAVERFAASCSVPRGQLHQEGDYWFARTGQPACPAHALLGEHLPALITGFAWPRSMRWGLAGAKTRWVRPLRSLLALLDHEVIPFQVMGLTAGRATFGHRLNGPDPLAIPHARDYEEILARHDVTVCRAKRKAYIEAGLEARRAEVGGTLVCPPDLLEEVTGLTENPVVFAGQIPEAFMNLPRAVLHTVMYHHQRYFALHRDAYGNAPCLPRFLCVANMVPRDGGALMMRGYERVLNARLADASFFWAQDKKIPLEEHAKGLASMLFGEKLGTMAQKVERTGKLAYDIAREFKAALNDDFKKARFTEASEDGFVTLARLAKADLTTATVRELPELQGKTGALLAYQDKSLQAYAPTLVTLGFGDIRGELPSHENLTQPAFFLALADAMDTLTGFFGMNKAPTGSKDPFALRRAATVVARHILWSRHGTHTVTWKGLNTLLERSSRLWQADGITLALENNGIVADVGAFVRERTLTLWLESQIDPGYSVEPPLSVPPPPSLAKAVFEGAELDFKCKSSLLKALVAWMPTPAGQSFLEAFRRLVNIAGSLPPCTPDEEHEYGISYPPFHSEEKNLKIWVYNNRPYPWNAFVQRMEELTPLVHAFFEACRIHDDDPDVRAQRLILVRLARDIITPCLAFPPDRS
jgi:glycyl-tRNA synthetase beta chain